MPSRVLLIVAAIAVLTVPAARAQETSDPNAPAVRVGANGNPFTGGLAFDPATVTVRIGQSVEWVNNDFLVPHTATEDHGLWNLGGTYPGLPGIPPGFGPGETAKRPFEAGTHHYYCEVHPQQMKGVVAVPVELDMIGRPVAKRRRRPIREVVATWAALPPAKGEVFDVQVRRGGGDWKPLRDGTRETGAMFRAGARGTTWTVRARLRNAGDAARATAWSPDASIVSDQQR
jgi:plastocyanin